MYKKWLWAVLAIFLLFAAIYLKGAEDRAKSENFRRSLVTELSNRLELLKDEWKDEYTAKVGNSLELKLIERFSEEGFGEKRAIKLGEEFREDIEEELHFADFGKSPSPRDFANEFSDEIAKSEGTETHSSGNLDLGSFFFLSTVLVILAKVYFDYTENGDNEKTQEQEFRTSPLRQMPIKDLTFRNLREGEELNRNEEIIVRDSNGHLQSAQPRYGGAVYKLRQGYFSKSWLEAKLRDGTYQIAKARKDLLETTMDGPGANE